MHQSIPLLHHDAGVIDDGGMTVEVDHVVRVRPSEFRRPT
jgi:hypothetical protein